MIEIAICAMQEGLAANGETAPEGSWDPPREPIPDADELAKEMEARLALALEEDHAVGGALVGHAEAMARLTQDTAIHAGGVLSPFNAWLVMRGMATLPLRMKAHSESALQIARFLETRRYWSQPRRSSREASAPTDRGTGEPDT